MKNNVCFMILLIIFTFTSSFASAEEIDLEHTIVDSALRQIISKYDYNNDGKLSDHELANITRLTINDTAVKKLDGIENLLQLKEIHLYNLILENNPVFGALNDLESLEIIAVTFPENSVLGQLPPKLKKINFHQVNNLTCDISILNNYPLVEFVHIYDSGFTGDLSSIRNMTNIKHFGLHENNITGNISSLSNLINLEYLDISQEQDKIEGNLSSLAGLTNLYHLGLAFNPNNTKLAKINGDLSSLSSMRSMKELDLANIEITGDISAILPLKQLEELHLYFDFTGDIGELYQLSKLRRVYLRSSKALFTLDNRFLQLTKLEYITTEFIKLSGDISFFDRIPALKGISIYFCDYSLPEIVFTSEKPITIEIPRISDDKLLIPSYNLWSGSFNGESITWDFPNNYPRQGTYEYYVDYHEETATPESRTVFCSRIIQPYRNLIVNKTVTFKVLHGSWDNETSGDITVTLTGLEGDELKLTAEQIPAVGNKPADTFKAGSWNVEPNTSNVITEDTTYTYTYQSKVAYVKTVPIAKSLTHNGETQELIIPGEAFGGKMEYALGENSTTAPADGWSEFVPVGKEIGTYYVWYMAVGDVDHIDSNPFCIKAKINTIPTVTGSTRIHNIGPLKIQVDYNKHYNWNEIGRIKVTLENRSSNKLRNIKLTNILPDGLAYATPEWKSGDIKLSLKPNEKKVIYIPVITGKATYKNNMRVTVSTDKQRYEKTDVATLTVRTDNFYDEKPIDNIKIQNFLSYGLEYVENQQPSLYISRLNPGTQQINYFKVRRQDDGDPSGLPQTGDQDENVHIFVATLIIASIGLLMTNKRKGAWK